MYAHLLILLNKNNEKRANTPVATTPAATASAPAAPSSVIPNAAYRRHLAAGSYDLPPAQIPNDALIARNNYKLQQTLPTSTIPQATRARLERVARGGREGYPYTGESFGKYWGDTGYQYLDVGRRVIGLDPNWTGPVADSYLNSAAGLIGGGLTLATLGRAGPALGAARAFLNPKNLATMTLDGAMDFAVPGLRYLTPGFGGPVTGWGGQTMRALGTIFGGGTLAANVADTVDDYQVTGNLSDALRFGAKQHISSIPFSPLGAVTGTAAAVAIPELEQQALLRAASTLPEAAQRLEANTSANPMVRYVYNSVLRENAAKQNPGMSLLTKGLNVALDFNLLSDTSSENRSYQLQSDVKNTLDSAIASGASITSVLTKVDSLLKGRGLDPATSNITATNSIVPFYENYLDAKIQEMFIRGNYDPTAWSVLSDELERLRANKDTLANNPNTIATFVEQSMSRLNSTLAPNASANSATVAHNSSAPSHVQQNKPAL